VYLYLTFHLIISFRLPSSRLVCVGLKHWYFEAEYVGEFGVGEERSRRDASRSH